MTASPQAAATQASLPITFEGSLREKIASLKGVEGWPEQAAEKLRDDPTTIVVVERPVRASTACLDGYEARVVLDSAWAHNPAVPQLRTLLSDGSGTTIVAHLDVPTSSDVWQWLFDGLLFLDAVVGIEAVHVLDEGLDRVLVSGSTAAGRDVTITAARTDTEQATIQILDVSRTRTVSAQFGDPTVASPPVITVATADQLLSPETAWETASRGAWRLAAETAKALEPSRPTDLQSFRQQMQYFALS